MSEDDRRWALRERVTRAIVGVLVLLALIIGTLLYSVANSKQQGDEVIDRWDPAYRASRDALAAMVNQETGVRGYALGRDEQFLEPYETFTEAEDAAIEQLRELLSDDDDLADRVADYTEAVEAWQTTVAEPAIAQVRAGGTEAVGLTGSTEAKAAFDAIRAASSRLSDGIDERRAESIEARQSSFERVWVALGLGALLLLAACLLLWRSVRRSVLEPIDRLAGQTRIVAGGDLDHRIDPGGPRELVDLGRDVDVMRARLAAELARVERARVRIERRGAELARSNADLEQFAYVASHDLSEPLRKVTNFCQLLERQYADDLDDKARRYIGFMVDGAKRMQMLINDLLAFSRVGRTTENFAPVDLDRALSQAISTLEGPLAESGAQVVRGPMPTVPGDATLLTALLQNLVGNAVKYRSPDRPQIVTVSSQQVGDLWHVTVDDEGIGIDREYADRIFVIFQRLHLRDEYGGTGIGLALCRKIVDFHGGRIWLAEKSGPGSTFCFTLPLTHAPREMDDDEPASLAAT